MNNFLIFLMALMLANSTATTDTHAVIERIEDGVVSVETTHNNETKFVDVLYSDFNNLHIEEETIPTQTAEGFFTVTYDIHGNGYFQFKSTDNSTWWMLSESEIGFIPEAKKFYTLVYYDNGTTAENKSCGCLPGCECEVYDDIFLGVFENIEGM